MSTEPLLFRQGNPYDPETFAEIEASDTEEEEELNEEQVFNLGRFCAERAWIHSKLRREWILESSCSNRASGSVCEP